MRSYYTTKQFRCPIYLYSCFVNEKKEITSVAPKYIEPGIKKYQGEIDSQLHTVTKSAGLDFTPYVFNDGRILLVLPNNTAAFLYLDKEVLYATLSLT